MAGMALARWLVGPTPMFVQLLLNDPDQQDRGFREMWGHLRSLKEGKISRDVARAALRRSPWLPSECIDRALDAVITARTVVAPATQLVSADECPWVLGPMLRNTPRGPEAHACIPANFGDDFSQDLRCVTLRFDGEPQRKLFRQQSGRYAHDDGEVLHLGRGAVWVVDATTRGGEVLRSSVLALLGEGELLAAFDAATGVRESPKLGDCAVFRLPARTQWQAKLGDEVLGSSRQPAPLVRRPPRAQEPPGLYLYDGMGWVKHAPDTIIECADVRNRPVQIRLDGLSEHDRVLLFEDSRLRFFPGHSRPMHLHDVVGLGGPLDAQITRYDDRREMVRLASALVDHGDIDSATLAGGELRLRLRKAKELEDRTHVAIWETSGNYRELPVTVGTQAVQEIRVPYEGPGLVAVALIVEDFRAGAWWSDDWHQVLSRVEDAQVSQVVERMYSMRLPMLAMPHRAVVGQWLARHAAAVLECLLANDSLASELGSLLCTATLRASDVRGIEDFARGMTTAADGVPRVLLLHEVVGEALLAIHPVAFASYYDQLVEMWRPAPRNQNLARIVRRLLLLKETTANSKFWTQAQRLVGEPSRYGKWRDALASQDTYLDVARALHAARQRGNFGSWLLMDKWSDALH